MNLITIQNNTPLVSSDTIAAYTMNDHRSVYRLIKNYESDFSEFGQVRFQIAGKQSIAMLNEDQATLLITFLKNSESVRAFKVALVKEFKALKESQAPALPQTYAEALLEAGRLAQELEVASSKLEQAKPKVEFVEKYVESTGNKGFRQAAKILGVKEPWFRTFLTDRNIMYKLGGEWTARQTHITAGRFVVKTGKSESDHAYSTAKFTPKGVEWIAGLIAKDKASQIMKGQ